MNFSNSQTLVSCSYIFTYIYIYIYIYILYIYIYTNIHNAIGYPTIYYAFTIFVANFEQLISHGEHRFKMSDILVILRGTWDCNITTCH